MVIIFVLFARRLAEMKMEKRIKLTAKEMKLHEEACATSVTSESKFVRKSPPAFMRSISARNRFWHQKESRQLSRESYKRALTCSWIAMIR
jgi:hypothetical protein